MQKVFVSYAHVDRFQVDQIVEIFRNAGIDVWYDHHLMPGQDWKAILLRAIMECDAFVYVLSPESLNSQWCQWEFATAVEGGKPIVPVRLQSNIEPPPAISRFQWADFSEGPTGKAIAQLLGGLTQAFIIPRNQVPTAPTSPRGLPAQAEHSSIGPRVSVARKSKRRTRARWIRPVVLMLLVVAVLGLVLSLVLQGGRDEDVKAVHNGKATLDVPEVEALAQAEAGVSKARDWTPYIKTFYGIEMVLVPKGCFMMGSNASNDEQPVREICFEEPFWIDRYEVTNAQFARYSGQAAHDSQWADENLPREQITWFEARDFCKKRGARLPTEAEWEYAARGPDDLVYPWGNGFDADKLISVGTSMGHPWAVGSMPDGVAWVGALDMQGNVWEWTSSLYKSYPYHASDGREGIKGANSVCVLRGGAWNSFDANVRASYRYQFMTSDYSDYVGFRCARSY